jgi:hypothetical protein
VSFGTWGFKSPFAHTSDDSDHPGPPVMDSPVGGRVWAAPRVRPLFN